VTSDETRDRRDRRVALNEALFRELNEQIVEVHGGSEQRIDFLCECGSQECVETIRLAREEYEAVRSDPLLFAMKPGHADLEVDVVVAANERFETVRKRPSESAIARETSPR